MEYMKAASRALQESAKGCAGGCLKHLLIAIAVAILLGNGAHYWGLSGRAVFAVVLLAIFLAYSMGKREKAMNKKFGGARRNRTADNGFADHCLTTWLPRHRAKKLSVLSSQSLVFSREKSKNSFLEFTLKTR